ncbi:MAG: CotH kinase family protein, partial [Lachnospiraceae bacterium]|nr:CotH kinase family protein [Lachnospiraceae bacterium]
MKLKRLVAAFLAFTVLFSFTPNMAAISVSANDDLDPDMVNADDYIDDYNMDEDSATTEKYNPKCIKAVVDEAKALGIPNAFYRHKLAEEFSSNAIKAPANMSYSLVSSDAGTDGIVLKNIDTGVLANTKIDLGEFDFGTEKVGRVVYNMLAKKNMKGKAYLYFGDATIAFASITIKRCDDESWEATKNLTADLRNANVSGKGHLYMTFVADSALDESGNIVDKSGKKGDLYLESIFFTAAVNPVLDFDIDSEVNTVEEVNGSKYHSVTGYGDMNIEIPNGYVSEYGGNTTDSTYELDYIRGRGNSTWLEDKKPYKVKLDKAVDLFGMGKNKHWVLLANYYDYSLMRNKLTYYLAEKMGLEFTPKSIFVDVVMDGEYLGSYQLSQHIRLGKYNIDIDDLEEEYASADPEITGGYLLTMGESWLTKDFNTAPVISTDIGGIMIDKPEYGEDYPADAKEAQINYVKNYIATICERVNALASGEASRDASGNSWREYLDEQSIIDYYLL